MARPIRIEYEHAFYHVVSRGHRRENIFRRDMDRKKFLEKLEQTVERHRLKIHVYVLMRNHYHLLIETPDANLSKAMHDLNASYANWYRSKYNLIGSIFQGRYKAILVEKDEYMLALSVYIHLNPVRAGIVKYPEAYLWSSFRCYSGKSKTPHFLYISDILEKFKTKREYQKYIMDLLRDEKEIRSEEVYGINSILGSTGFIRRVLAGVVKHNLRDREIREVKEFRRLSAEDLMEIIIREFRIGEDQLKSKKRGNLYRKFFIYMLRKHTGMSLRAIGELMEMDYGAVSELARYFGKEIEKNKEIKKMVKIVNKKIRHRVLG